MIRETYAGRKIAVRALKGINWGRIQVTLNGEEIGDRAGFDELKALNDIEREIDEIDAWTAEHGVDGGRWEAKWFRPGSYEVGDCGHARDIGGVCRHDYCVQAAKELPRAGEPVRYSIRESYSLAREEDDRRTRARKAERTWRGEITPERIAADELAAYGMTEATP